MTKIGRVGLESVTRPNPVGFLLGRPGPSRQTTNCSVFVDVPSSSSSLARRELGGGGSDLTRIEGSPNVCGSRIDRETGVVHDHVPRCRSTSSERREPSRRRNAPRPRVPARPRFRRAPERSFAFSFAQPKIDDEPNSRALCPHSAEVGLLRDHDAFPVLLVDVANPSDATATARELLPRGRKREVVLDRLQLQRPGLFSSTETVEGPEVTTSGLPSPFTSATSTSATPRVG